jgi:hypothetical protein
MISRGEFLSFAAATAGLSSTTVRATDPFEQRAGHPRGSGFVFARLRYESGDWDDNPKVVTRLSNGPITRYSFAHLRQRAHA